MDHKFVGWLGFLGTLFLLGFIGCQAPKPLRNQLVLGSSQVLSFGGEFYDAVRVLAVDSRENIVVGGVFYNKIRLGTYQLVASGLSESKNVAGFVAKLSKSGSILWAQSIYYERAPSGVASLAIDKYDNILITGYSEGAFVTKLSSNGSLLWKKRIKGASVGELVRVSEDNSVWAFGYFESQATIDTFTLSGDTGDKKHNAFLMKLDSKGKVGWVKVWKGFLSERPLRSHLAIDRYGYAYLAVRSSGSYVWGGEQLTSRGKHDIFVLKFNRGGKRLWTKQIGGKGDDRIKVMLLTQTDKLVFVGYSSRQINTKLPSGEILLKEGGGYYLAKLDGKGTLIWGDEFLEGAGTVAMAVGNKDQIYLLAGSNSSSYWFRSTFLSSSYYRYNGAALIQLSQKGRMIGAQYIGKNSFQDLFLVMSPKGFLAIAGNYRKPGSFLFQDLQLKSSNDFFIASLELGLSSK